MEGTSESNVIVQDSHLGKKLTSFSKLQASLSANIPITNNIDLYANGFYVNDTLTKGIYNYTIGGTFRSSKNLTLSLDYSVQNDDQKIGFNIIVPFGSDLSFSSSFSGTNQINNHLNYSRRLTDSISTNLMVGHNYNKDMNNHSNHSSVISGSISEYNDYYSGSIRAGNNNNNTNYGFSFNTTQLANREGFFIPVRIM